MNETKNLLGLIGLGTMGRNLLLNMADSGFSVCGYDKDAQKAKTLEKEANNQYVTGTASLEKFMAMLGSPKKIMLLVPAGDIVDQVIEELLPHLNSGDLIIDGGNSHFEDTNRRQSNLETKGIEFLGLGVSGGSEGARNGPCMMAGGTEKAYGTVQELLESIAAKVDEEPCVAHLGPTSAGHYVKMVHNGIEYGMMQLISEAYDIMGRGLEMNNQEIHKVFKEWNGGKLESFLINVTASIFSQPDDKTEGDLIDEILDRSKQKGTGKWTLQEALNLGVPVPVLDTGVSMRYMSSHKSERTEIDKAFKKNASQISPVASSFTDQLGNALYFGFAITYIQGMALLKEASQEYDYGLDLGQVASIWRGGCIIRAGMLEIIKKGLEENPAVSNLLLSPGMHKIVMDCHLDTRQVIKAAIGSGVPIPALMASVSYFDAYSSQRLPANLIQAQRDFFGAHTYERIDLPGVFHTNWN